MELFTMKARFQPISNHYLVETSLKCAVFLEMRTKWRRPCSMLLTSVQLIKQTCLIAFDSKMDVKNDDKGGKRRRKELNRLAAEKRWRASVECSEPGQDHDLTVESGGQI